MEAEQRYGCCCCYSRADERPAGMPILWKDRKGAFYS